MHEYVWTSTCGLFLHAPCEGRLFHHQFRVSQLVLILRLEPAMARTRAVRGQRGHHSARSAEKAFIAVGFFATALPRGFRCIANLRNVLSPHFSLVPYRFPVSPFCSLNLPALQPFRACTVLSTLFPPYFLRFLFASYIICR